uniref:RE1-silencing transcription factor n=1 Tax=Cacopsylla melanoneura TaxID=428564 RepID=A0A8D9E2M2_9HEMI
MFKLNIPVFPFIRKIKTKAHNSFLVACVKQKSEINRKCIILFLVYMDKIKFILFYVPAESVKCQYCHLNLAKDTNVIVNHSKVCHYPTRSNSSSSFVCIFCSYYTAFRHCMRDHVRKHIGDKPFVCPFCPYTATQKAHLTVHIKVRH